MTLSEVFRDLQLQLGDKKVTFCITCRVFFFHSFNFRGVNEKLEVPGPFEHSIFSETFPEAAEPEILMFKRCIYSYSV